MSISPSELRVAIVGSGPAGFYAAEALQKAAPGIRIDLFDRLPTPFGLVRGGVAPDHPKIKSVTRVFDRIATQPGFRFLGHVRLGEDISVEELRARYDVLIVAVGAETDHALGISGEHLAGSHAATEFVGWFNGHPDYVESVFDLSQRAVAIVGIGNVAMDIARILAKNPDHLATTDIADHALRALRSSGVTTIHLLARRGPVQAACTTPELRELGELEGVDVVVDPHDIELDPASAEQLANSDDRTPAKNLEVLRSWAERTPSGAPRKIVFHFNVSPLELTGTHRVEGVELARNRLEVDSRGSLRAVAMGEKRHLAAGLVFRSVGYRGIPLAGLPFDDRRGVIPNIEGRVIEGAGSTTVAPGLYVCGWIKRGPQGVIGTNKSCAAATVEQLLADVNAGVIHPASGAEQSIDDLLRGRGVAVISWEDWLLLDQAEQERGAAAGRPREKVTSVVEMLEIIRARRQG